MFPLRKIAFILLCVIAAIPLFMSPAFLAGRIVIRKTMLSRLASAELHQIIIPLNELKWYNEGHELLIEGRMFDVKSIVRKADQLEITGLFDDDETSLNEMIVAGNGKRNQETGLFLFKSCLGLLAIVPLSPEWQLPKIASRQQILFYSYSSALNDGFLKQLSPPPDAFLA